VACLALTPRGAVPQSAAGTVEHDRGSGTVAHDRGSVDRAFVARERASRITAGPAGQKLEDKTRAKKQLATNTPKLGTKLRGEYNQRRSRARSAPPGEGVRGAIDGGRLRYLILLSWGVCASCRSSGLAAPAS